MNNIIIDTSVIIAYLNKRDQYHEWAVETFKEINPPLITCEAVLAESFFLLRKFNNGNKLLFELLKSNLLHINFSLQEEWLNIEPLIENYANLPMSLADACLVRMAEIYDKGKVLTLDSDFKIYKKNKNEIIELIFP